MTEPEAETGAESLSDQAFEIAKRRQQAAVEVLRLLERQLGREAATHPQTVLHAAAWLAGTSLYRSLGHADETAPGTVVLSEKANEEWPKLMKVFSYLLDKEGLKLKPDDLMLTFPGEHSPRKSLAEIQQELQDPFNEIMKQHGFDYAEGAKTGAVACAMLVKAYCVRRKDLDSGVAAGIVEMGFIEGAKTAPAPLGAGSGPDK